MTESEYLSFIPETKRKKVLDGIEYLDQVQILQLLGDLGYVKASAFENNDISSISSGIKSFRSDYHALSQSGHADFRALEASCFSFNDHGGTDYLSEKEEYLLKYLTSIDGEFDIAELPQAGKINLISRIINYRLRIYGLANRASRTPFTNEVIKDLQSAKLMLDVKDKIQLVGLLGDQEKLLNHMLAVKPFSKLLFHSTIFFSIKKKNVPKIIEKQKKKFKDLDQFTSLIPHGYKKLVKNVLSKSEGIQEMEKYNLVRENKFMLRLLQIRLWTMGLYQGRLDYDFGLKTFGALQAALLYMLDDDNEPDFDDNEEELGKLMYAVNGKQWAFNIHYFLDKYIQPMDGVIENQEDKSISEVYNFVLDDKQDNVFTNHQRSVAKVKRKEVEREMELSTDEYLNGLHEDTKKKRRRYHGQKGIKKFLGKFFNLLKKGFSALIKLVKRLFKIIKSTIASIFAEIRDGIKAFAKGMKLLFGDRKFETKDINNGSVITDFDIDFDAVTITDKTVSEQVLEDHADKMIDMGKSLYTGLSFVRDVIKWGLAIASGGWIKIAIGIARLLKNKLIESIKGSSIKPAWI